MPLQEPPMDITVREEQARVPVTIFEVSGDIDINTSAEFLARARQAAANGMRDLVVDLSNVRYISSAGIRVLHQIFLLLRTNAPEESDATMKEGIRAGTFVSPHLRLVNPSRRVEEALKMPGLDMYLAIHPTLEEALAAY
jgi:anti-anti-sigma factor